MAWKDMTSAHTSGTSRKSTISSRLGATMAYAVSDEGLRRSAGRVLVRALRRVLMMHRPRR
ncbi:hypothetical protein GCM10023339_07400 [Alloalcanivorax gelatiniphagus]